MSFFRNIIADSRRQIISTHDVAPISKVAPVDSHTSAFTASDTKGREINKSDAVSNDAAEMQESTKILVNHNSDFLLKTINNVPPSKAHDLASVTTNVASSASKAFEPSPVDVGDHISPFLPMEQLRANAKTKHGITPSAATNRSYREYSSKGNRIPLSSTVGDQQVNVKNHHLVQEQQVSKQDVAVHDLPNIKKIPLNSKTNPVDAGLGEEDSMTVSHVNSAGEASEHTTQSTPVVDGVDHVSPALLTEHTAAPMKSVRHHIDTDNKQQPRVQIGQVNVVIAQITKPSKRASAMAGSNDYASRNFLKSL